MDKLVEIPQSPLLSLEIWSCQFMAFKWKFVTVVNSMAVAYHPNAHWKAYANFQSSSIKFPDLYLIHFCSCVTFIVPFLFHVEILLACPFGLCQLWKVIIGSECLSIFCCVLRLSFSKLTIFLIKAFQIIVSCLCKFSLWYLLDFLTEYVGSFYYFTTRASSLSDWPNTYVYWVSI